MKVDKDSIRQVLALFDPEDIPYIRSDYLLEVAMKEDKEAGNVPVKKEGTPKVKKIGEVNGRFKQ